jgi:cell division protein FtsQ
MKEIVKKLNFKKILNVTAWALAFAGLVIALGFVNKKENFIKGKKTNVNVDYSTGELFIDSEDILQFLKSRNDTISNVDLGKVNINKIEKALLTHPAVENAEVSLTVDGNLKINVTQREPILRVYLPTGESFYLDKNGKFMPLSDNYTSRVLIAGGNISQTFSQVSGFNYEKTKKNKIIADQGILDELVELTRAIQKDSVLSSITDQIFINEKNEFELIPSIGDHKILLGSCNDLENKFNKLKIFYREGLNHVNGWNTYSCINLKHEGQVICTKKQTVTTEIKTPQP